MKLGLPKTKCDCVLCTYVNPTCKAIKSKLRGKCRKEFEALIDYFYNNSEELSMEIAYLREKLEKRRSKKST